MLFGILIGAVAGGLIVFSILWGKLKQQQEEAADSRAVLTKSARKASIEASELRRDTKELQLQQKEIGDLILVFPDLIKQIFSGKDIEEVANLINRSVESLVGAKECAVFLADRSGSRLALSQSIGLKKLSDRSMNIAVGDGFTGFAAETGKLLVRDELENETVLTRRNMIMTDLPGFKPDYAVPMQISGVLYGVITAGNLEKSPALRTETLRTLAAIGAAALENTRVLERFSSTSSLDKDTGFKLSTALHTTLEKELERVERFGTALALLELTVKSAEADDTEDSARTISIAADHLRQSLRNIDIGIRLSRGTAILLLPGTNAEGLKSVIGKIGGELPVASDETGITVGAIGIRSYLVEGNSKLDSAELLCKLRAQELMEFEGYYQA